MTFCRNMKTDNRGIWTLITLSSLAVWLCCFPLTTAQSQTSSDNSNQPPKNALVQKLAQYPGGTIALFEGWPTKLVYSGKKILMYETAPNGDTRELRLRVTIGNVKDTELKALYRQEAKVFQAMVPNLKLVRKENVQTKKGLTAQVRHYVGSVRGNILVIKMAYLRSKDDLVAIHWTSTEQGDKRFAKAFDLLIRSVSFQKSAIDRRLVGAWSFHQGANGKVFKPGQGASGQNELTIYPNGLFVDKQTTIINFDNIPDGVNPVRTSQTFGLIKIQGKKLTFYHNNGTMWSATPVFRGREGLILNRRVYLKQK